MTGGSVAGGSVAGGGVTGESVTGGAVVSRTTGGLADGVVGSSSDIRQAVNAKTSIKVKSKTPTFLMKFLPF